MLKRIAAAAIAAIIFAAPASADYKRDYTAYAAALDAGDLAAAIRHGEAAWRAAEVELGDHATTAILAYNYATLVADFQPTKAAEAFARALAITEAGVGALSVTDLKVRLAEAMAIASALKPGKEQKALLESLVSLLEANPSLASESPEAHARGWRTVAVMSLRAGADSKVRQAADLAIESAASLDPIDNRLLAESLIIGAVARLTSQAREGKEIVESIALLDRAIMLFPPQVDIDSFDRLLALALSWRISIRPLAESTDRAAFTTGTRLVSRDELRTAYERGLSATALQDLFAWSSPKPAICGALTLWASRKSPRYPTRALNKSNVGAIIVGYDLNETGVERSVLLADFPETGFGEAALKAMKSWRLESPPPSECRKNNVMFFTFEIR